MAGSVLRLTILVVFSSLPNYSVLQRPESLIQNPFRLIKTNFLTEFMRRREEIFPFSFTTTSNGDFTSKPPSLAKHVLRHQFDSLETQPSNVVVKRKVPRPVLENERVQNFLRQKIGSQKMPTRQDAFYSQNNNSHRTNLLNKIDTNSSLVYVNSSAQQYQSVQSSLPKIPNFDSVNFKVSNVSELESGVQQIVPTSGVHQIVPTTVEGNEETKTSFLGYVISTLTQLPVIGNVLRASVDPLYRPIVNQLQPDNETIMRGENDIKNWCFGVLGCIQPSHDFFHPLYRPVNLPPYPREQIDTLFIVHSRNDTKGYPVPALRMEEMFNSSFVSTRPTKLIIHGYLNDRQETWILEMVRGLLAHGDYNVIVVDWSGGSFALYSQATANARVVGLETARMLDWTRTHLGLDISTVHIVGHSLGAHTAGYVGEKLQGLGRITGLDPAEPFFQYMPDIVRLDPSDAFFVDVIHTDIDSFFGLTGPRGFGLQQAVGHIDFYPNGGKDQPGCNQLLARVPMTLMLEGEDLIEGINAAQTELINCDHVRSAKLFTDSLNSNCPYLGFACPSYKMYKAGKCFTCGDSGNNCAFMGINADLWTPRNQTNVKVFLDTHYSPNFCKYHYILTINFADPEHATGTLRGRMKISLINEDGNLMKFDLTALSPLKFPRRGERTFLLEHFEDISTSQEALINWTFESDLLDPMTFCVIFCKADITISSISILSVDTPLAASRVMQMRSQRVPGLRDQIIHGGEIVMCHKKGESVVSIPSESTVKISASPSCKVIQRRSELHAQQQAEDSFSNKVYKAAASYYNG